jgi:4-amino-4-deoxy-L-arabinose transferase-like glycosyltransferase
MSETEKEDGSFLQLPKAIGGVDHVIGIGIGAVYVTWLMRTARSLGFARDEGFYFHAASDYARWFELFFRAPAEAMARPAIDASWATNHEHPALMKSLFALSFMYLHEKWKLIDDASTAFRFPGMVMGGIAMWVTYLFAARAFSRRAGVIAALLLGLMPNVFYHAHLACFDVPIMAMWVACIYVYWRSLQEGGFWWALASGVMYGLTLETKHNAWILPAVFIPHAIMVGLRERKSSPRGKVSFPSSLLAMATIGPLVFYWLWPWLWNDTLPRLQEYVNFHMNHEYYNIEFLHRNYFSPPSPKAYAPVMIAATVPTITLILYATGTLERLRAMVRRFVPRPGEAASPSLADQPRDRALTDVLLFLAFCAPLAVFFLPKTPIFGGTKHWMPAYPFLAIFAGRGFDRVAAAMHRALPALRTAAQRFGAELALGALIVMAPLAVTQHSHPFGLSAYVPIVGGTAGGADLGLCRQFWGFTTESVEPYFEKNAPPNARVFIHDTAWDSWYQMTAEKRVRPDLQPVGSPGEAQIGLLHHELHMNEVDFQEWAAFDSPSPDWVLTHDGVPIVSVYRRK